MRQKTLLFVVLLTGLAPRLAQAQASVGYYPWSGLLTVSTSPDRTLWLDTRLQTNSLFASLSVDILPMLTLSRSERVQWYMGGGVRVNPLYRLIDPNASLLTLDGYSVNVGVRAAPFQQVPNLALAVELNPFVKNDLASGVLKSHFGLVYVLRKKP